MACAEGVFVACVEGSLWLVLKVLWLVLRVFNGLY